MQCVIKLLELKAIFLRHCRVVNCNNAIEVELVKMIKIENTAPSICKIILLKAEMTIKELNKKAKEIISQER